MTYIKLDDVTEELLLGNWRVNRLLASSKTVGQVFATYNCIRFLKGNSFTATGQNGKRNRGHWEIIREQEMIYNPQVKFHLGKKVLINSIITNLMTDDSFHFKLILYFDSGFELVLEKEGVTDLCRKKLHP